MANPKQFICMKWGTLYGPEYVNRLYAMARYFTTGPIRFVCLTDDRTGLRPEIECHDCPEVDIPMPWRRTGWRKIATYARSENFFGLTGQWLFMDLDVVVTGPLDDFFTWKPEKTFVVMQNWTQPGQNIGNTSVYRFTVGADEYLLTKFLAEHEAIIRQHRNEQIYISRTVKDLNFWPDEWCVLFKVQCVPAWPLRFFRDPVVPAGARIVAFPGVPNPHEAVVGEWPAKPWKKIYKFVRPATWIRDIWDRSEQALGK